MCAAVGKINPAIAKDMKNGNLLCLICNTQVKTKTWIAHSNGRKHHENIELLKKHHTQQKRGVQAQVAVSQTVPSTSVKRIAVSEPESITAPAVKKRKEEPAEHRASTSYTNGETPWQKGKGNGGNSGRKVVSKHVIAGVPEGFFDDEKMDSRVEETMEKQAKMEEEYANFMNELKDAENKQEREDDVEEETFSLERDVSNINEHIDGWKALNRLEIHREEIAASTLFIKSASGQLDETSDEDENDSDSLGVVSWRNKPYS